MRKTNLCKLISLTLALLCVPLLSGQGVPVNANAAKLDQVLAGWEKAMAGLQSLALDCERTTKDRVFPSADSFKGTAKFLKSSTPNQGSRASLELFKDVAGKPSPDRFEKYIISGTFLYEFDPSNKVIRVHTLPPPKQGQVADDNLVTFLFGMKAVDAKERYQLTFVPADDKWYYYLKVEPKLAKDKAEFREARLALLQSNFLPAQVWFLHPNSNEVTWNFRNIQPNAVLKASEFEAPALPKGWQIQRVQDQKPKIRGGN